MGQTCDTFQRLDTATAIANSTTDFFTALAPPLPGRVLTVSVSLDTAVKLYVRINGVNNVLNGDVALVANAMYTFSMITDPKYTYTFRSSAACGVNFFAAVLSME